MPEKKITNDAMNTLISLPWTGNIRELRNMIERLIILSEKSITQKDVIAYANPGIQRPSNGEFDMYTSFQEYKDHTERDFIKYKLEKNAWNVSKTAEEIEIQRSHLYSKIEKFGLKREG
jgi:DNA-binding NtrC family response regulator